MNAIDVHNLSFRYPDGRQALSSITFSVPPAQCIALVGPNGAGKSTLLLHLNGLLPEGLGNNSPIHILGQPVIQSNLHAIRRQVGLLFQHPDDQLFCPTVFEDVAFGPEQLALSRSDVASRVRAALAQVGLPDFDSRLPHHLSSGEKRRVCLAGLLACDSSILLLDEPTSGLDPRGKRQLMALLTQIPATRIIATHDLELVAQLCSRALLLDAGRLIADGPALQILSDEPLMLAHGLEKPHILRHLHPHL